MKAGILYSSGDKVFHAASAIHQAKNCINIFFVESIMLLKNNSYFIIFALRRDVSSVGSERLLDRQEVAGSIPARPTVYIKELVKAGSFLF
jgi:hypothetical protein